MCNCKTKCGCNITTTTKGEKGDASSAATLGYKVYSALLTQEDINNPIAIVLSNTLGGIPIWNYGDIGFYTLTLNGAFSIGKTFIIGPLVTGQDNVTLVDANTTSNSISITTFQSGIETNGILFNSAIEIRVYN